MADTTRKLRKRAKGSLANKFAQLCLSVHMHVRDQ